MIRLVWGVVVSPSLALSEVRLKSRIICDNRDLITVFGYKKLYGCLAPIASNCSKRYDHSVRRQLPDGYVGRGAQVVSILSYPTTWVWSLLPSALADLCCFADLWALWSQPLLRGRKPRRLVTNCSVSWCNWNYRMVAPIIKRVVSAFMT
jgi:hypothetical protein